MPAGLARPGAGAAWGALLLGALGGCFGRAFQCGGPFLRAAALLMRAPRMQKLHVVFLECGAVNGGVNGASMLSSAYLICTVRVRKSFGLCGNDLPYGTLPQYTALTSSLLLVPTVYYLRNCFLPSLS